MITLNLSVAGQELTKKAVGLYGNKTYRYAQKILAENLVNTAIEAGRLTAEASYAPASRRERMALRASEEVGKLVFILEVMMGEGILSEKEIKPVEDLALGIRRALSDLIIQKTGRAQRMPVGAAETDKPEDEDGFNDTYFGNL